ncbi:MAG: transcriptional regulator [Clostridiales bacterium]|nr:transcriptional regulator [Clostridiales bacterium]
MSRCTTNKEAWQLLFNKYNILEEINQNGYFKITSKQINEFREARLMTKFDNSANLPELFKDNNLAILPITSNSYMISKFQTYKKFEKTEDEEILKITFPEYIQSLDYNNITSEALAINCAYITQILEDFLDEEDLVPTISGKMGSGNFEFKINKNENKSEYINVSVRNSRIEIDGGFEGINSLALVEAKNVISDDFMVRQLYYPYRLWKSKINKPVRPIYMVYSNGIFNVYEYKFENDEDYSSIKFVKSKKYSIEDTEIDIQDIQDVFNNINEFYEEPEIAFPQADSFNRVINLCELLLDEPKTKSDITENYAFDERQTNYYTDGARYLGLVNKIKRDGNIEFELSQLGRKILNLRYKQRQLEFVKLILKHKAFYDYLNLYFKNSEKPTIFDTIDIMKHCDLYNIESESTYKRRASTIRGWIEWILDLTRI